VRRKLKPRPPRAIFVTGAGLSAESGVPTFHGSGGAYGRFANPEEVVSAKTLKDDPDLIHEFIDDMRVSLDGKEPNEAHRVLARLERTYGPSLLHLTQNIDDLCEKAGCVSTVHLHGFLTRMRSVNNPKLTVDIGYRRFWGGDPALAPERGFRFRDPKTNSRFRPDVVLFDEFAWEYTRFFAMRKDVRADDILVIAGTRGNVLPVDVNAFLATAPCRKVLSNLHESEYIDPALVDDYLMMPATEAFPRIEEMVTAHLGEPAPTTNPSP
jgi:NAD-dependent deacetylase